MSSVSDLLNPDIASWFDARFLNAMLDGATQRVKDALAPASFLQTRYALIHPYLVALLPLLGPAALAAAFAKLAAYGPAQFRLAFTVAFVNMMVCLGENILRFKGILNDDISFRLSQASCALDIVFAITFALRIEMPPINASLAANLAISTASVSVLMSQISQYLSSFYSRAIDEVFSGFTSTAATAIVIVWASQFGTRRAILVAASSAPIVYGNLNWWQQDETILTWMRLSELLLAAALAFGSPNPSKPDKKGSKPSEPAVAT